MVHIKLPICAVHKSKSSICVHAAITIVPKVAPTPRPPLFFAEIMRKKFAEAVWYSSGLTRHS